MIEDLLFILNVFTVSLSSVSNSCCTLKGKVLQCASTSTVKFNICVTADHSREISVRYVCLTRDQTFNDSDQNNLYSSKYFPFFLK